MYLTLHEYEDCWTDNWSTVSKDAIQRGLFDKFAGSAKRKRGAAEVDDAILKEIEQWRE